MLTTLNNTNYVLAEDYFQSEYTIIQNSFENKTSYQKKIDNKIAIEYPKNFNNNEKFVENISHLEHKINSGFTKWSIFNGIRVEQRNFNLPKPLDVEILSINFPYFKMHFSLEGNYSYKASNPKSLDIYIPKGQHQLFYFPDISKGRVSYKSENSICKSIEITLSIDFIHRVFNNSWEVLEMLGEAIKQNKPFVFGEKSKLISPEIYIVLQQIKDCNIQQNLKKAYLEAKVIELLVLQINELNNFENNNVNVKNITKIKAAKAFIEANIDSDLTIPFIAKNVGININYLKSEFKELYNQTIFQHLTSLRMKHAKHLVIYTGESIAEIASKVGYTYPQHFTKAFKKHFEKTPSVLRKEKLMD